jgi:thioredoxin reductase/NAD-dependent dihydropyrimidine dehydrogenase PreA subunit
MSADFTTWLIYLSPMALIIVSYVLKRKRHHQISVHTLAESAEAGLLDPASLHPIIDPVKCIGCGSCVAACPEMPAHQVIGMIRRKAELVSPTDCIGHGACQTVCPVDAITLVFGTERRGIDIPNVQPNFETNVPGIFIAGELGGMGLIKNAIEQGKQAIDSITKTLGRRKGKGIDVLIIGAGPSGISASLAAKQNKLNSVTIEQDSLGGTVSSFPRRKLVMTAPATLPIVGKMRFRETTKENLLAFWQEVEQQAELAIKYQERLESVQKTPDGFKVKTTKSEYDTRTILLAIGRRGTPRKLGVPGEELSKVAYKLIDPEQFRNQRVLIVGGGDSAIESAISIGEEAGTEVTLSYRSAAFSRAKQKNRSRLAEAEAAGRVKVLLESNLKSITDDQVELEHKGNTVNLPNDAVIINAGGILPTGLLKELGIEVETKFGTC